MECTRNVISKYPQCTKHPWIYVMKESRLMYRIFGSYNFWVLLGIRGSFSPSRLSWLSDNNWGVALWNIKLYWSTALLYRVNVITSEERERFFGFRIGCLLNKLVVQVRVIFCNSWTFCSDICKITFLLSMPRFLEKKLFSRASLILTKVQCEFDIIFI